MTKLHYGRKQGVNLKKLFPKEFNSFSAAKQRTNGQNPRGVRWYEGIEFRFNCFRDFLDAVGPKPSSEHTLERIKSSGHYESGNICWATRKANNTNRRNSRLITWEGETLTVTDWEHRLGWGHNRLRSRLNRGWSVERAMTQL